MTIAFVNSQSGGTNNSNSTSVTSITSGTYTPTAGNCLIIVGGNEFGSAVTSLTLSTTTGNTIPNATDGEAHLYNGTGGNNIAIWAIPNVNSTAGTWKVTEAGSSGFMQIAIVEYSGVDSAATHDGTAGGANSNVSPNITTTQGTSIIIAAGCYGASNTNGRTSTHTSGFTQRYNDANTAAGICNTCLADDIGPAAGTYSDTITWSPSVGATFCSTVILGLKAASVDTLLAQAIM